MPSKNKIIFLFIILSAVFLAGIAVLAVKKSSLPMKIFNNPAESQNKESAQDESKSAVDQKTADNAGEFKWADGDQILVDEDAADALEKLKKNNPDLTADQLKIFSSAAKEKSLAPCDGRSDRDVCVSSVAFISRVYNFCGDIGHSHEEGATEEDDAKYAAQKLNCYNSILSKKSDFEISKCYADSKTNNDEKIACLSNVFPSSYEKPEDCSVFSPETVKMVCEGVVRYRTALMTGNNALCQKIKEIFIKGYCLKNI